MTSPLALRTTPAGRRELTIVGPLTRVFRDELRSLEIDELYLNYALGFAEADLEFVRGLTLQRLEVLAPQIVSLSPVADVQSLAELQLTVHPSARLHLGELPDLDYLGAPWSILSGIGETNIATLYLEQYGEADLRPFARIPGLRSLILKERPKVSSLAGFDQLPHLRSLEIYGAVNLLDISELAEGRRLTTLVLEGCRRVRTLQPVAGCGNLRYLNCGDGGSLANLSPLGKLSFLEVLYLFGSTRIADANLAPILDLVDYGLRELRMMERKVYRPKVSEIQAAIANRGLRPS